jgi:hypothetical protein
MYTLSQPSTRKSRRTLTQFSTPKNPLCRTAAAEQRSCNSLPASNKLQVQSCWTQHTHLHSRGCPQQTKPAMVQTHAATDYHIPTY